MTVTALREVTETRIAVAAEVLEEAVCAGLDLRPGWSLKVAEKVLKAVAEKATEEPMRPGEVATAFRVDPKTVTRWAKAGLLPVAFTTAGGEPRYAWADVMGLRAAGDTRPAIPNGHGS